MALSNLDAATFTDAINRHTTGVSIITTVDGGIRHGATVASLAALAFEPAMVSVSLSATSATGRAIERSGAFAVSITDEDGAQLAGRFASSGSDPFDGLAVTEDGRGIPLISGLAHFSCRLAKIIDVGSHRAFHAFVDDVQVTEGLPLAYFRGSFARLQTNADELVLRDVRHEILSRRADRAETIDPRSLADKHGIPLGMVVRAMSALASESLIERRSGLYYLLPVPDDVVDAAYDAKLTIEVGVAQQIVGKVSEADLQTLRNKMRRLQGHIQTDRYDDLEQYLAASHDFHEFFVGLTGSPSLVRAYRALGLPGIDRRTMTDRIFAHLPVNDGYQAVVEALEREDLDGMIRALRAEQRTPRYMRSLAAKNSGI